jgi:2-oxoglutarate ferredoxin oxidoreductase subunit alpha
MVVVVLSDASLATSQQPFPRPQFSEAWLAPPVDQSAVPEGMKPYDWHAATGLARRFIPGQRGGMHTLTGLAHDRDSHVAYDPEINEESIHFRSLKLAALQRTLKAPPVFGDPEGDLLVIGWGSTKGAIEEAVEALRAEGAKVSSMHLQFLQPLPPGIKERCSVPKVMTIEGNWSDSPEDESSTRRTAATRARDAAARALSRRRRLLERGARPADQAGTLCQVFTKKSRSRGNDDVDRYQPIA